jgi:hypothetical protein
MNDELSAAVQCCIGQVRSEIIAFSVVSDDSMNDPNAQRGDG